MGVTHSIESKHIRHTSIGSFEGIELTNPDNDKPVYRRFTRIPFAQPPVGALRWRRPQKLPTDFSYNDESGGPGDYTKFGPMCPQPEYSSSEALVDNPKAAPPLVDVQDEDCLYLNIWVPAGTPPDGGWPVQVYIHGGWLQMGDAGSEPFDLLASTKSPRIIVTPTYRLNLFGFLDGPPLRESKEDPASGNYGFWDQRMAIEWVHQNISNFEGNRNNITVGGLSAGAHSTFVQLYYDSYLPKDQRIIKQVYMWSNAIGVQPKLSGSDSISQQFDELVEKCDVSSTLSATERLEALRATPSTKLVETISKLKMHTFRATTDDSFIPSTFLRSIHDGSLTAKLKENGTRIMIGEVANEDLLYKLVNPPSSFDELVLQLNNYYPEPVVQAVLKVYPIPSSTTASKDEWASTFGRIAADCQVHAAERGLVNSLFNTPHGTQGLTVNEVFRYRISWRAESLDQWLKSAVGVCHASDAPIWWCTGWRAGYTEEDKDKVMEFLNPFGVFLEGGGKELGWGTKSMKEIREMDRDGNTKIVEDEGWERGLEVWNTMRDAQL